MLPVFHVIRIQSPVFCVRRCSHVGQSNARKKEYLNRVAREKKKGVFCNLNFLRGPDLGRARMSVDHFSIVDHYH